MGVIGKLQERALTEEGLYFLSAIFAVLFSLWLVTNGADPKAYWVYSGLLLFALVIRFMTKSRSAEAFPLFSDNPWLDIGIGIVGGLVWIFTILKTPFGIMPLPPLPATMMATSGIGFLVVVFLAPFEEFPFRSALLATVQEIFGGLGELASVVLALFIQALAFAVFHWMVYLQGELSSALIASFIFALYVGIIALYRKSILSAMIIHAIVNFAIIGGQFAIVA